MACSLGCVPCLKLFSGSQCMQSRELSDDGALLGTEQIQAVLAALTTMSFDFQSATPIYQGAPAQLREQLSLGCEEVC